jgi:hypothetical protein
VLRVDIRVGGSTHITHTSSTGIGGDGLGYHGMFNGVERVGLVVVGACAQWEQATKHPTPPPPEQEGGLDRLKKMFYIHYILYIFVFTYLLKETPALLRLNNGQSSLLLSLHC